MSSNYAKYGGLGGGGGGGGGTVTSVSVVSANGLAGTVATPTTTPAITLSTTVTGILQGNGTAISAATTGDLTDVGTDGIVVTGGTGAVLGSGTSLAQHVADSTHNGYLSSTDWTTFNGKQGAGNYITALTGDVTAAGPGSVAATLATVNSNIGSFGSSTSIPSFTVNGKGLITAASGNVVIAPAGTLTGTTLASNVVTSSLTSLGVQSQALNLGSHLINSVTDPVSAQDAATKAYVDASVAALNPATSVYAATTANIAGTYLNGVSGVGATFTTTATGTFTVDGVTPPLSARVLIKDQSSGFQNGIYTITTLGTLGVSTVFTRALDYNTAADMNAAGLIPVINGTVNALSSWQQTATITTVGTDALVFQEFTANPSLYLLKANNLSDVASKTTSFNNLSPMTTAGDIIYGGASGTGTRLATGSGVLVGGATPSYSTTPTLTGTNFTGIPLTTGVIGTLPIANGGTGQVTAPAAFTALSPITTTGDLIYSSAGTTNSRLGIGSAGNVLTVSAGVPAWVNPSAYSGGAFFASSQVTTLSSTISSGSFTTFSNSPALSFTPSVTGTYKVYCSIPAQTANASSEVVCRIIATSGSPTLLYESESTGYAAAAGGAIISIYTESVYTLTAGVAYVFDIQGKDTGGVGIDNRGDIAPFYMFASGVVTGTGALSLAAFGSSPNANGATLSASTLTLQPASASFPGGVSTTTQTFAGAKSISTGGSTTAFNIDSPAFIFDSTNKALGLGVAPNSATFLDGVNSTGAAKRIILTGYGASSTVGYRGRFARGTSGSPAAAQNGDILNFISGQGYGTSQFPSTSTGSINLIAGETFTNTSNATYITIQTTPTTSVTAAEAMRINSTGNVLIGTTSDSGTQKLQVSGNSNVGTVTGGVWNGTNTSGSSFLTVGSTYTTDASVTSATRFKLTLIGGGGGGAGTPATINTHGASGGAAGVAIVYLTGLAASTGYSYAIGANGAGSSNATGTGGGNTTFTGPGPTTYTAAGGGGATTGNNQAGGTGGTTTNATIGITGQAGGAVAGASATVPSMAGGSGMFGSGGSPIFAPASGGTAGQAATGFGAGGGGSATGSASAAAQAGGNGSPGAILVEWWN